MTDEPERRDRDSHHSIQLLTQGTLKEVQGLLPWGSNYTILMGISDGDRDALVIYKPRRGERPLWDFPEGTLCQREVAAFVVSEGLGWNIVPPTVLRDGPMGIGMVQLYIDHDPERHYFTFDAKYRPQLQRIVLFDHITNNADRKGGHCLLDGQGAIWAIDHGVCFHCQPKLRSVIWDFAGQPIPEQLILDVKVFCSKLQEDALGRKLKELLSPSEIGAMCDRASSLIQSRTYPEPGPGRHYPWPPI